MARAGGGRGADGAGMRARRLPGAGEEAAFLAAQGLTLRRLRAAWRAVRAAMPPTPLLESPDLSRRLGRPVWLKAEVATPVRAFKVRGAVAKVAELRARNEAGGLVTASAGNHGLAVAWAGRRAGLPVTVYVPRGANPVKVAAIAALGAEVCRTGIDYQEAAEAAEECARRTGKRLAHPFDDPAVIAGQATVGREIACSLPDVAEVAVAVGGGGLAAGVGAALALWAPAARVVGVEMRGADSMLRSLAAGHVVALERVHTVADGLAPRAVSERTLRTVARYARVLPLEDESLYPAMRWLVERERLLAEPSGAATVAAALEGLLAGEGPLVLVVSGANVTPADLARALAAPLPEVGGA